LATWAELIVPPRRLTNGEIAWLAFVTVQALDGMLSYIGVHTIGIAAEGNPMLAWYVQVFGPAVAFIGAKLFAVGCGVLLHVHARHQVLGALTAMYVVFAIGPWIHLLAFQNI
jgi:hypothetical protein